MLFELIVLILAISFFFLLYHYVESTPSRKMLSLFISGALLCVIGLVIVAEGIDIYDGQTTITNTTTNTSDYINESGWLTNTTSTHSGNTTTSYSYIKEYNSQTNGVGLMLIFFGLACMVYSILLKAMRY